jgi:SAM-dependent methyltransferase
MGPATSAKLQPHQTERELALYSLQDRGSVEAYRRHMAAMDASMREKIARTTAHFPASGVIADLGSGSGSGSFSVASLYPHVQVLGIDVDPTMIELSSRRYQLPNLRFITADIGKEFAPPSSLDGVFACSVFHHLTSFNGFSLAPVKNCLDQIAAALKPGGKLVVRDFVIPEGPNQIILELPSEDGVDSGEIEALSTAALFRRFARDFRSSVHPDSGVNYSDLPCAEPGWKRYQLSLRDATEFLLRKDYRKTWDVELQEEYTYFSRKEFHQELEKRGLRVSFSSEILNPWIVTHRLEGKARLFELNGRPLPFPPTNLVITATKVTPQEGTGFKEERLAEPSTTPFTSLKFFRHIDTGAVYEIASRPNPTVDLVPWFEDQGNLWIIGKVDYPRPILTVDKNPLDHSGLAGYIAEPLTAFVDEVSSSTLDKVLTERSGISQEDILSIERGLRYYPSPGAIDQCAQSELVEIKKPSSPLRTPHYSNFSTSGAEKPIEALQLLRAAAVGGLFDSRLEVNTYHLLIEKGRSVGPWIGAELSLLNQDVSVPKTDANALFTESPRTKFHEIVPMAEGRFYEKRTSRFTERNAQGNALAENILEYATPRSLSSNTLVYLPLAKVKGEILVGIEERDLPAGIAYGDGSRVLTPPAFRVPKGITNLPEAHAFAGARLKEEFGEQLLSMQPLGGRYYPSPGLVPEVVYPFAVEVDLSKHSEARSSLYWVSLSSLMSRYKDIHDAHLLTGVLRAAHALELLS